MLATSQVLDEGIDVPAANVGIILSGSASKRQYAQRLDVSSGRQMTASRHASTKSSRQTRWKRTCPNSADRG